MEKKGVVIYQLVLPISIAETVLDDMNSLFENNKTDVVIDVFFLQEVTSEDVKYLSVKITCDNLRRAQVEAVPVFRYLALIELAITTFPEEICDMYINPETDPVLHIGKHSFRYSEVFAKQ